MKTWLSRSREAAKNDDPSGNFKSLLDNLSPCDSISWRNTKDAYKYVEPRSQANIAENLQPK